MQSQPYNRRQFINLTGGVALAATLGSSPVQAEKSPLESSAASGTDPVILSNQGSGRATAYWEQNKIISVGNKTHVVWLDGGKEGFRVRGRTLDRAAGRWQPIITIGEAQNNHGGPSLTVDSKGYLHILYYPHHEMIRYRRSLRPNDISEWGPEIKFGEHLSYPTVICGPDDTLILSARRYYLDAARKPIPTSRVEQELWKMVPGGEWQRKATLLRSRHTGYAQFATAMAWGPDGKTIHLNCRIAEGSSFTMKPITTVAYMRSVDAGETWTKADGTPIALPATGDSIDVLANDGGPSDLKLNSGPSGGKINSGPLAVNAAGVPYLIYTAGMQGPSKLYLATPAPGLGWTRRDLTDCLPKAVEGWDVNLGMGGGMVFSDSGRATIVAVVLNLPPEERAPLKEWGHPSTEVVRLWSDDGCKTFKSEILAPMDPLQTHWLPNIERATGHNRVSDEPGIIYTAGGAGPGLSDLELNNQVWWRPRN